MDRRNLMHPAFATITFGPFQTVYHRQAVDDLFREELSEFLEHELLPQASEPFTHTQGRLTAVVNEERFCGPNSLVRDNYTLEFSFIGKHGSEETQVGVRRHPKTGLFEGQPLLWTKKRRAEDRSFREAIDHMVKRIRAGKKSEWTCPRCSARLSLTDSPKLFDLRCPQLCFIYNFHRDPKTGEFIHGHSFVRPPQ